MKVTVRNLNEARQLCGEFDAVISVVGSSDCLKFTHPNHHREYFDDICDELDWGREPRQEHIERIIHFVRSLPKNSRILVHCHAGISRSTATGMGVLMALGWNETEAQEHIITHHPDDRPLWPNALILRHFDALLGSRLAETINGHLASQPVFESLLNTIKAKNVTADQKEGE